MQVVLSSRELKKLNPVMGSLFSDIRARKLKGELSLRCKARLRSVQAYSWPYNTARSLSCPPPPGAGTVTETPAIETPVVPNARPLSNTPTNADLKPVPNANNLSDPATIIATLLGLGFTFASGEASLPVTTNKSPIFSSALCDN